MHASGPAASCGSISTPPAVFQGSACPCSMVCDREQRAPSRAAHSERVDNSAVPGGDCEGYRSEPDRHPVPQRASWQREARPRAGRGALPARRRAGRGAAPEDEEGDQAQEARGEASAGRGRGRQHGGGGVDQAVQVEGARDSARGCQAAGGRARACSLQCRHQRRFCQDRTRETSQDSAKKRHTYRCAQATDGTPRRGGQGEKISRVAAAQADPCGRRFPPHGLCQDGRAGC
mmetsp:Transcript_23920/g.52298  ORF Transcript_23920/g.52298 Transcript_23920/m.52298 type:complete len:233 (-) Transcript_23920:41-739(-)